MTGQIIFCLNQRVMEIDRESWNEISTNNLVTLAFWTLFLDHQVYSKCNKNLVEISKSDSEYLSQ